MLRGGRLHTSGSGPHTACRDTTGLFDKVFDRLCESCVFVRLCAKCVLVKLCDSCAAGSELPLCCRSGSPKLEPLFRGSSLWSQQCSGNPAICWLTAALPQSLDDSGQACPTAGLLRGLHQQRQKVWNSRDTCLLKLSSDRPARQSLSRSAPYSRRSTRGTERR